MPLSQKILIALFAVLLLFVAVEAGVFWGYQSGPKKERIIYPTQSVSKSVVPTVSLQERALNASYVYGMQFFKKGVVQSSIVTSKYQGKIIELDTKGNSLSYANIPYKIKIKLTGSQNLSDTFYFFDTDMNKAKIIKIEDLREIPINFNEIKVGDTIAIEITVDLMKSLEDNVIALTFTKI